MTQKNSPLVSVIIPAFNAESYIAKAVESILAQTYTNFECIIVDDASTDTTASIVAELAKKDTRIRLILNQANVGIGANRKKALDVANGQYICWQDADDVSTESRVANQLAYLESHPDVGIVGGYMDMFGSGKSSIRRYAESDTDLRRNIFRYNPVAQPASFARAECYRVVGSYDESLAVSEDLDMLFRIGTKFKFANLQEVVVRYRLSADSLTASKLKKMELTTIRLRYKYARHNAYHARVTDYLYNALQLLSVYLVPARAKMALFSLLRDRK